MSRFQLSLNVADVDEAVAFYSRALGVEPAKHRPGYANFAVENPPLKLVVIEGEGDPGTINHMGVEFESTELVTNEIQRITDLDVPVKEADCHTCCYARQEKAWLRSPDGHLWEVYTVLEDTDHFGASHFEAPEQAVPEPATCC